MEEKKIYSLNLIAFLLYDTGITPIIRSDNKKVYYAVFPENTAVSSSIRRFKEATCEVELHKFLQCYNELRQTINKDRGE